MKKSLFGMLAVFMAIAIIGGACKKDKDDDNDDNNNINPPAASTWNLNVLVDLSGEFTVIATAAITITGGNWSAAITTSQIGGGAEVHSFTINGTVASGTYTVSNHSFTITVGGGVETVTITSGTHTTTGNTLSGSGNVEVLPAGMTTPMAGTYTGTGTL
jgi:hypothetical protein